MAKTSIDIPQLRFNKMSTAKYEELKQAGQLVDNEFYITPDVSNSDIPTISSSTNDYVLSNDGNQLNWVQESEYTKNRIDSKLDDNIRTNCITKIPQDIKYELKDNEFVLKAGSKIYIPNGFEEDGTTLKFDEKVFDADISASVGTTTDGKTMVFYKSNGMLWSNMLVENCLSEDTVSPDFKGMNYDNPNNIIKFWDKNTAQEELFSLPLAIITVENSQVTMIDQVFNGFGYIGNTLFTLPGIECLSPNGRNEDGSLNNIKFTTSNVKLISLVDSAERYAYLGENKFVVNIKSFTYIQDNEPIAQAGNVYWINEKNNTIKYTNNQGQTWSIMPYCLVSYNVKSNESGKILEFNPKNVFNAVDRSDTYWASSAGKPSNKYVDLTLNATGSSYTAPANGWVTFAKRANNANEYNAIHLEDHNCRWDSNATAADMWCSVSLPVKKNEKFIIEYTTTGELQRFRFIYDEGVK